MKSTFSQIVKAGIWYFGLVFGAGFILGIIRVVWLLPPLGNRWAELAEMPVMLVVMVLAARWVVRRLSPPVNWFQRMGVGLLGLGLLVVAELSLVFGLQGLSWAEYLAARDPVSGTVYLGMLLLFGLMPGFMARR